MPTDAMCMIPTSSVSHAIDLLGSISWASWNAIPASLSQEAAQRRAHMPDVRKMVFVRAATSTKPTTAQKRCLTLMRCGDDQVIPRGAPLSECAAMHVML